MVVRFYELRNPTNFVSADYFSLHQDEAVMLGDELVSRQEYVMAPGETRLVRRRADLQTRFVGIAASFRNLEDSAWRAVSALPSPHFAGLLWGSSSSPQKRYVIEIGVDRVSIRDEDEAMETAAR